MSSTDSKAWNSGARATPIDLPPSLCRCSVHAILFQILASQSDEEDAPQRYTCHQAVASSTYVLASCAAYTADAQHCVADSTVSRCLPDGSLQLLRKVPYCNIPLLSSDCSNRRTKYDSMHILVTFLTKIFKHYSTLSMLKAKVPFSVLSIETK